MCACIVLAEYLLKLPRTEEQFSSGKGRRHGHISYQIVNVVDVWLFVVCCLLFVGCWLFVCLFVFVVGLIDKYIRWYAYPFSMYVCNNIKLI